MSMSTVALVREIVRCLVACDLRLLGCVRVRQFRLLATT